MSDTFTVSDTQWLEPADICISWVSGTDWIWDLVPISRTGFTQNSNEMKIIFCSNTQSGHHIAKHFAIYHETWLLWQTQHLIVILFFTISVGAQWSMNFFRLCGENLKWNGSQVIWFYSWQPYWMDACLQSIEICLCMSSWNIWARSDSSCRIASALYFRPCFFNDKST